MTVRHWPYSSAVSGQVQRKGAQERTPVLRLLLLCLKFEHEDCLWDHELD